MVAVPSAPPETTPDELTDAMILLLLDHVPPETVLPKAFVCPRHAFEEPVIGVGPRLTVAKVVYVATQPDELVSVNE